MCSINESSSLGLVILFIAVGGRCALLQHRFATMLRREEPKQWEVLSARRTWNEDGELHESAVFSYIIQGLFQSLQRKALVELGVSCRRWYFVSFFVLFALGAHSTMTKVFAPITCLWS
jgi:hypothetical protein